MESARPGSRSFHSTASVLPGQAMASVEELKKELELNSENSALKLSILTSLITKVEGSEKVQFLKQKIHDLIELNAPHEASIDIESLLALENSEETQHLNCSLLFMKKDYVNCMTKLLRSKNHSELFDKTIEHLLDSSFFDTLYVIPNLPDLYSSQMTFFPELRGKVVLQICSSSYQTYILISTCPHFAYKTACPKGLYNCSEELQLLEVSNSILTPVDFLSNQKLEMVSCSDYMTGVLHRSGRITLWGELPNGETHQIIEYPCREIAVGSKFALFVNDESIGFWGKLSGLDSNSEVICIAENSGNVKCSDFHVMLLSNGKVACLGIGEEGQLGLGDLTVANEFTSVDIELNVDQILCNNEVSVAITREVIYVWGMINPLQLHSDSRNF